MLDNDVITLNPSPLVRALGKPAEEFTKADIITFIREQGITMLNFRYVAGDGRLKKLDFVINSLAQLDRVLTMGERVDGSSLFDFVGAISSDLYVVPRYSTAFVNPFDEQPSLDLLCSFFDVEGRPLDSAPEQVLAKAHRSLTAATGLTMEALGELEYYVVSEPDPLYPVEQQRGYHEGHPFSKWGLVRREAMAHMAAMGCQVKYGHAEVGNIMVDGQQMVQQEIEFLPVPIEQAADQLVIAKWVLREVAYRHGLLLSFAPKIIEGQAGSGMHVHMRLMRDGRNALADAEGLTETGRKAIAGLLQSAASLTAFGNTVPTSFLRLVPHQEAPTSICWGERNRSALVRVPLGWRGMDDRMVRLANPGEPPAGELPEDAQTIELRSGDGSADVHLYLAGMACAVRRGLTDPDSLAVAEATHVDRDASELPDLAQLPDSCHASAQALVDDRATYEADGVFPSGLVDARARALRAFDDQDLRARMAADSGVTRRLVAEYLHCG